MIPPGVFFNFSFSFWFFRLLGWEKGKNSPKWEKIISVALYVSRSIHHMIFIYGTHVQNDNIYRHYFCFFKILIFWVVRGVKGQKMVQNKKTCLPCPISQETYILFSFMVHMCKMIISMDIFFIFFKILIFQIVSGKRAKNSPKWEKI